MASKLSSRLLSLEKLIEEVPLNGYYIVAPLYTKLRHWRRGKNIPNTKQAILSDLKSELQYILNRITSKWPGGDALVKASGFYKPVENVYMRLAFFIMSFEETNDFDYIIDFYIPLLTSNIKNNLTENKEKQV
jgi:hypothetical protein